MSTPDYSPDILIELIKEIDAKSSGNEAPISIPLESAERKHGLELLEKQYDVLKYKTEQVQRSKRPSQIYTPDTYRSLKPHEPLKRVLVGLQGEWRELLSTLRHTQAEIANKARTEHREDERLNIERARNQLETERLSFEQERNQREKLKIRIDIIAIVFSFIALIVSVTALVKSFYDGSSIPIESKPIHLPPKNSRMEPPEPSMPNMEQQPLDSS